LDGEQAIGFRDLLEVRFVSAFRKAGVPWKALRVAARRAADLLSCSHPFSHRSFRTDGRNVFLEIEEEAGDKHLVEIISSQEYFVSIISPYLKGITYGPDNCPLLWHPIGNSVVLDPARRFGQPIVPEGVPTEVIGGAFDVSGDIEQVAGLYEISLPSARDAVEYEKGVAAA
jgi:hypothetical protein